MTEAITKEKLQEWLSLLPLLVVGFLLYASGKNSYDGPEYCEKAMKEEGIDIRQQNSVIQTVWTRAILPDYHWVAAVVLQPIDLSQGRRTIICHFEKDNFVFRRFEIYERDLSERIKDVSRSLFDPRAYLKF